VKYFSYLTLFIILYLVNMVTDETQDAVVGVPSKHDIISCLAVNGRWITSQMNLQVVLLLY